MDQSFNSRDIIAHKENLNPSLVSKEKVIIQNNLANLNRSFGRDLANVPRSGV